MNNFIWPNFVKSMNQDLYSKMVDRKGSKTISKKDYEIFCKEFVFDSLKGESFGEAFCKRFDITDSTISILKTEGFTKELIKSLGYIEE